MSHRGFDPERYAPRFCILALGFLLAGIWIDGPVGVLSLFTALALLLLACYSRDDGLLLFGPFVRYELVAIARRTRLILWRSLYALILLFILGWVYGTTLSSRGYSMWEATTVPIRKLAEFSEVFFTTFIIIQGLTAIFLAPGFMAEVIAEEKDRNRLQFLLATDLRNREIVFGKIAARIAYLFSFIFVGLPIIAMLPFFGGVDPAIVIASTLGILITIMGIMGLAIFATVFAKTAKQATGTVTGLMFLYMLIAGSAWLFEAFGYGGYRVVPFGRDPIIVRDVITWINAGNPISIISLISFNAFTGMPLEETMAWRLKQYATFHILILVLFGMMGITRLRFVAAMQSGGAAGVTQTSSKREATPPERPPVSDRPVLWKELHFSGGLRNRTKPERVVVGLLALASLIPAFCFVYAAINPAWARPEDMNVLLRVVTAAVACVFMLNSGAIASRSIAREKDRQTFDGLYLTGMDPREILWQKWLGAFASARWVFYWMLVTWMVAVATGALHILAIPAMIGSMLVYQSFMVSLGIRCSVRATNAEQANKKMHRMLMLIVLGVFVTMFFGQWLDSETFLSVVVLAEVPPAIIGILGFRGEDLEQWVRYGHMARGMIAVIISLAVYGFIARLLWQEAATEFEADPVKEGV